jgi:hypothetical protein
MTTATATHNRALVTLAARGDRPRCSDPIDQAFWNSHHQHHRDIAACWRKAVPAALPGPLALPGDEPVL